MLAARSANAPYQCDGGSAGKGEMKLTETNAVAEYVAEVTRLAKTGKTTEHSFRGVLAALTQDDLRHYQRIILALAKTRNIMEGMLHADESA